MADIRNLKEMYDVNQHELQTGMDPIKRIPVCPKSSHKRWDSVMKI
jgi:hypothetical protein